MSIYYSIRTALLAFMLTAGLVITDLQARERVTERCAEVFRENNAVPQTPNCRFLASTANVDLGTYGCKANPVMIVSFCDGDLPLFDEDSADDDTQSDDEEDEQDDGTEEGAGDESNDDDDSGDETDDGSEDGADDDGADEASESEIDTAEHSDEDAIEIIIGEDADSTDNADSQPEPLPNFDDVVEQGQNGVDCDTQNPIPTLPSAVDVPLAIGTQFLPNAVLSNYGNLSSAATLVNLTSSAVQAQETGDSSGFFSNVFSLVLPFIPQNSTLGEAFQNFSEFVDGATPGGCR